MKKILMSSIIVILLIMSYMLIFANISIGKYKSKNVSDIKNLSYTLDNKIQESNEKINMEYASKIQELTKSIKDLRTTKEKYENKVKTLSEGASLGATEIERYKIEFLWTRIGNYAKDAGLKMDLVPKTGTATSAYNLDFTLIGTYKGITDFLYNIENDENLNFKPIEFNMVPYAISTTDSKGKTTTRATDKLKATFVVEDIVIFN